MMMLLKVLIRRIQLLFRRPVAPPTTQQELAGMVNYAVRHEIRQGFTHRFITLMFVTVGDRVFCRRYSYNEPSWYSAFVQDPVGQLRLDKTIIDVTGSVPEDLEEINPLVNEAYAAALEKVGAVSLLEGATEPRALASTFELKLRAP